MITLRHNQIEPVEKGIKYFQETKPVPSLIIAPTAAGKSIIIAKIAESIPDKLLVVQPSKELLQQNYEKYTALGEKASIYSASLKSREIGHTTYATIGSIASIGKKFKEAGFTKMIIDEADRYPRENNSMLGRFLADSGITHVLGLTATPLKLQTNTDANGENYSKLVMLTSRSKKGNFFKEIIHVSQISEMIKHNYWSKLIYKIYEPNKSQLSFNSSKSDYSEISMANFYKSNDINGKIVRFLAQIPERKSILIFVPSIPDALALARLIPDSIAVYGNMGAKERSHAVSSFKKGKTRIIINVNVLSVGFDHPELDCIIMARPTASLSWYYQALGRITRIHPNKQNGLIVDFSGNVKKFGPIEKFTFVKENIWKLYGENGILLTGVPMDKIGEFTKETEAARLKMQEEHKEEAKKIILKFGKHSGKEIKDIFTEDKPYLMWMLEKFTWLSHNMHIKEEIERLNNISQKVASI